MKFKSSYALTILAALAMAAPCLCGADIAPNFQFTHRGTGKTMQRGYYNERIIMLDFFAYWCPPCVTSSPSVERDIAHYYRSRGGNAHGVKVEVIGVNVEKNNPSSTDSFIANSGLTKVANDYGLPNGAWKAFSRGSIPHFVIINGTSGGSHQQWEVLHSNSGYRGAEFYRNLIDSIAPSAAASTGPKIEVLAGSTLLREDGKKNFGRARMKAKPSVQRFTIRNTGTSELAQIRVSRSGLHSRDFKISQPRTTLQPGQSTKFKVSFSPKTRGTRIAAIRVFSNDADASPFDITAQGKGSPPRRRR